MACGIYKIENKINHKIYIGQSKDIALRWKHHEWEANNCNQVQYNYTIHRAFRKYGLSNFDFTILEECKPEQLDEREQYYIQLYDSLYNGYNETTGGDKGPALLGSKNPKARLTEKDVIDIREAIIQHQRRQDVYEKYKDKISQSAFNKVWAGNTWTHIRPDVIEYMHSPEYKHWIKTTAAKEWHSQTNYAKYRQEIQQRKKQGEERLKVYQDYKNIYTIGGFNKVWYYE